MVDYTVKHPIYHPFFSSCSWSASMLICDKTHSRPWHKKSSESVPSRSQVCWRIPNRRSLFEEYISLFGRSGEIGMNHSSLYKIWVIKQWIDSALFFGMSRSATISWDGSPEPAWSHIVDLEDYYPWTYLWRDGYRVHLSALFGLNQLSDSIKTEIRL